MSNWLPFDGTASDQGDVYHLTPNKGDGVIAINKDDVQTNGGKVEVRVGTIAKTIKESTGKQPANLDLNDAPCDKGKTKCIGCLMFCCADGRLIGVCIGAWGC
jgi:hypothetical protein